MARIVLVAVIPSITGIIISMRITSKASSADASNLCTASSPLDTGSTNAPQSSHINRAISMFNSLSSATKILRPVISASAASSFSCAFACLSSRKGITTVKQLPSPSSLSITSILFLLYPASVLPHKNNIKNHIQNNSKTCRNRGRQSYFSKTCMWLYTHNIGKRQSH